MDDEEYILDLDDEKTMDYNDHYSAYDDGYFIGFDFDELLIY